MTLITFGNLILTLLVLPNNDQGCVWSEQRRLTKLRDSKKPEDF